MDYSLYFEFADSQFQTFQININKHKNSKTAEYSEVFILFGGNFIIPLKLECVKWFFLIRNLSEMIPVVSDYFSDEKTFYIN
ncbi:MAG TPA: hypothetical protein DIW37_15615 [Chryseobacterium sp.]|nr:hypothetical protein [Chryseobacterium sp.]